MLKIFLYVLITIPIVVFAVATLLLIICGVYELWKDSSLYKDIRDRIEEEDDDV